MSFEFSEDQLRQMRDIDERAEEVARRIREGAAAAQHADQGRHELWTRITELAREAARRASDEHRPFDVRVFRQQYHAPRIPFGKRGRVEETDVEHGWRIAVKRVANNPISDERHPGPVGKDAQEGIMLLPGGRMAVYRGSGEPHENASVLAYDSKDGRPPSPHSRSPFYLDTAPDDMIARYLPTAMGMERATPLARLEYQLLRFIKGQPVYSR